GFALVRALALDATLFHQNGQGPLWIRIALTDARYESMYGPGYAEILHGFVRLGWLEPVASVVAVMNLLTATIPVAGFVLVRSLTKRPLMAWCAALGLAVQPVLNRLGMSESYFGLIVCLCFASAALLACPRPDGPRWRGLFAAVLAGLFAAMAARVHPLAWPPVLVVPGVSILAVFHGRHSASRAVGHVVAYILALGVLALGAALDVQAGPLGQAWWSEAGKSVDDVRWVALGGCALGVVGACLWRRGRRLLGIASVVYLALWGIAHANLLRVESELVQSAFYWGFAPLLLAALVTALDGHRPDHALRHRLFAGALWVLLLTLAGFQASVVTYPTDVREQRWAHDWLGELPPNAHLVHVQRVSNYVLMLPIWADSPVRLTAIDGRGDARVPRLQPGDYLYRSHLCSEPVGA
ncbi:MAG: hypothetical protein QF464_21245, partial [Myxococcota bacterium]|nr:hypothetical protein [Myxococcota bacterium]